MKFAKIYEFCGNIGNVKVLSFLNKISETTFRRAIIEDAINSIVSCKQCGNNFEVSYKNKCLLFYPFKKKDYKLWHIKHFLDGDAEITWYIKHEYYCEKTSKPFQLCCDNCYIQV